MPKNFRRIPPHVKRALQSIDSGAIVVGVAKKVDAAGIAEGSLSHLQISLDEKGLHSPKEVVPPANRGKYSRRNLEGYDLVRKDLGLETRYHSVETPNWGDPYYGTHEVDLPYQAYPRDHYPARLLPIRISCQDPSPGKALYLLSFQVPEVMDRHSPQFQSDLLANLNLLQENIGTATVVPADLSIEDYAKTLHVSWEILPPGTKEEVVARVFGSRIVTCEQRRDVEDRYAFLMRLSPAQMVLGSSGFQRYFGALLGDELVVFDNIEYGNAAYIMFQDWRTLSQRSRTELLSGRYGLDFERVPHVPGWKSKVLSIVEERRKKGFGRRPEK